MVTAVARTVMITTVRGAVIGDSAIASVILDVVAAIAVVFQADKLAAVARAVIKAVATVCNFGRRRTLRFVSGQAALSARERWSIPCLVDLLHHQGVIRTPI